MTSCLKLSIYGNTAPFYNSESCCWPSIYKSAKKSSEGPPNPHRTINLLSFRPRITPVKMSYTSNTSKPPNKIERQGLAEETKSLTPTIVNTTNATNEAILYSRLLAPLPPSTTTTRPKLSVQNMDSFTAAQTILDANPTAKIGVLNMASEKNPGGGWLRGALAQEEALCMRSTLAATLYKRFYPLPIHGAIWSPMVAVFRDEISSWGRVYQPEEIFCVGVVSMPALRRPALTGDKRKFGKLCYYNSHFCVGRG